MSKIKVSVVVPIYNGEKYLEKSLLMLSKQTLEEIEFILVNDASKDNSLNICLAFKEVFPNKFVVINSEKNRGPGGARNIGISYAKGEYIGFMDADDYAGFEMFEKLYNEAVKQNYDIVCCGYYDKSKNSDYVLEEISGKISERQKVEISKIGFVWNKIYKKTLLDKMDKHFRENVKYEDTDFTLNAIMLADNILTLKDVLYYYNSNIESLTRIHKVDLDKEYAELTELFENIEIKNEYIAEFKRCIVLTHLRAMCLRLFCKVGLLFEEFKRFFEFANKYLPDFYEIKYLGTKDLEELIWNELENNAEEAYKNLLRLREKIESGKLDEEMRGKSE